MMNKFLLVFVCFLFVFVTDINAQISKRTAVLKWDASVEPNMTIVGYNIYRGLNRCSTNPSLDKVGTTGPITTWTDTNIPLSAFNVCYSITAFNDWGESPFSNKVDKVINLAPAAPSNPSFK